MAQTQAIKRRIRSVRNAKQITKALEVVAASRMRRVQDAVTKVRAYGQTAEAIMRRIATTQEAKQHPFFNPAISGGKLYIIFTSDRGQAGAFNSNIFNLSLQALSEDKDAGNKTSVIVFGRKGARFFSRLQIDLLAEYQDIADAPQINVFAPVMEMIKDGFNEQRFSSVSLIYTKFNSALSQKARRFQLLPVDLTQETEEKTEAMPLAYEFEPEIEVVIEEALRIYFESKLMQVRVESAASEHAMRMVAMGNANRNASDLIEDLTLELNATRQAAITQEIAEITGGAEALAA